MGRRLSHTPLPVTGHVALPVRTAIVRSRGERHGVEPGPICRGRRASQIGYTERAMKNTGAAYLLAALGLVTPVAGIHRFYLGRPVTAVLYLVTWGFFGIGTVIDLINLSRMVDDENRRLLYPGSPPQGHLLSEAVGPVALPPGVVHEHLSPEQQILRVASENHGAVTVELVAVKTSLSLRRAKKELERLRKQDYCTVDITAEGATLYVFEGLRSTKPLELS